jgi:hypothetical protein
MRRPRVRIWMMMVGVVVVALTTKIATWGTPSVRRQRFVDIASAHSRNAGWPYASTIIDEHGLAGLRDNARKADRLSPERRAWHGAMAVKYRRAAEESWKPVMPDPPEPD